MTGLPDRRVHAEHPDVTAVDNELPWVRIKLASKDQYTRISHPGARYAVYAPSCAAEYYRTFADAKAAATALVGSPVRWQKRTYLDGRQMASEWTPVAKEATR